MNESFEYSMGLQLVLAKIKGLPFTNLYALKFLRADISPGVLLPLWRAVQQFMSRFTMWHQRTLHTFVPVYTFPFEEVRSVNFARAISSVQKDDVSHTRERVWVGHLLHKSIAVTYTGYVFSLSCVRWYTIIHKYISNKRVNFWFGFEK
jgi:hypothetical protein